MTSFRGRMADRLVRAIGLKRRLQALADIDHDSEAFARSLARLRRTDRRRPPFTNRLRWDARLIDVTGSDLFVLSPRGRSRSRRVLFYLHGGGYLFGPFGTEWAMMRRVAGGAGTDFAVFLYPRAPEHNATETLQHTSAAYYALADRYGAGGITLVGTSAGGGLAVALMASLRDDGVALPSSAVLLSPGVDMTLEDDVDHLAERDIVLPVDHVLSAGRIYAGPLGPAHPSVSPSFGNLAGLPPLHLFVADAEILRPSIELFAERARAAGTETHLVLGEGQQHTWPVAPTPEGRHAREKIIALLRSVP